MRRLSFMAAALAAAGAGALALTTPVQARDIPSYYCEQAMHSPVSEWLEGRDCSGSKGAVMNGKIKHPFLVGSRKQGAPSFQCQGGKISGNGSVLNAERCYWLIF